MTFRSVARSNEALLADFESALALQDIALLRSGEQFLLASKAKARGLAVARCLPSAASRLAPGYQAVIVPTNHAAPSDIARLVSRGDTAASTIVADDKTGYLTLIGSSGELNALLANIAAIDRPAARGGVTRTFSLTRADPLVVVAELKSLSEAADFSGTTLVPLPRLGQIVATARSDSQMSALAGWIARLDTAATQDAETLWRYRPLNLSAEGLAQALTEVSGRRPADAGPKAGPADPAVAASPASGEPVGGGADWRIGVQKEANTLLVFTSPARWRLLEPLLDELDKPPAQVMIEATVLEVTLGKSFRLGVDWSLVATSGQLNIVSSNAASGAVAPTYPGLSVTYLNNDVKAVVDALSTRTNVQVVSAPKLSALDNHEASLQVGDQVPIVNQTSRSTSNGDAPIVSVTEYRDTGVILKIKPRINGANSVVLDFSQEVSTVSENTISDIDSPTIQQRRFQSQVELVEGETVALGGMMSTRRNAGGSGVPWLSELPGVGALFGTRSRGDERTEMIVLLKARILRDAASRQAGLESLRSQLPSAESHVAQGR